MKMEYDPNRSHDPWIGKYLGRKDEWLNEEEVFVP